MSPVLEADGRRRTRLDRLDKGGDFVGEGLAIAFDEEMLQRCGAAGEAITGKPDVIFPVIVRHGQAGAAEGLDTLVIAIDRAA